ncbi:NUMOD4 domain-containing protein [uncultured Empedobacter sp.]|uniref:HNH endonuclease n=1 Tax=uncultured Empedobacter sp. TaxID=410844 RepID=UPI002626513D|nr:NUMOD4 domain-containing protein [uncultured Empedobacter sp.]
MADWKDIKEYEGLYQINSKGEVRSLDRVVNCIHNSKAVKKGKAIKHILNSANYYVVNLYKNGKVKQFFIHRLIAIHFIPNPENKKEIDHINTNTLDNSLSNLRWATRKENVNNPISKKRRNQVLKDLLLGKTGVYANRKKGCIQIDPLTGIIIKRFSCMSDAVRELNIDSGGLTRACQGKIKTCGGYKWTY